MMIIRINDESVNGHVYDMMHTESFGLVALLLVVSVHIACVGESLLIRALR